MWNDDSIIEKICEIIAGVNGEIVPENEAPANGRLHVEAAGGKIEARRCADGSTVETVPVKLSLKVKLLSPEDGLKAVAALEKVCRALECIRPFGPVTRARLTTGPSRLSNHDGAAEYGAIVSFYVYRPAKSFAVRRYINTGSREEPVWSPADRGFLKLEEITEPEYYTRRFIDEISARRTVVGSITGIRFRLEAESGGDAAEMLRGAAREKKKTSVEVLTAFPSSVRPENESQLPAIWRDYSVAPSGEKFDGEYDGLTIEGTLWACGEEVAGKFNANSLTFTADGS